MPELNPFAGAILPSAQAQRQQGAERVSQVRRGQERVKNAAHGASDTFEHQVESSDALSPIHDQARRNAQDGKRRDSHPQPQDASSQNDDDPPRLDVTA